MGTIRYAMIHSGGHWRLVGPRRSLGDFQTLETAATLALKLAATARSEGWDVELLVQERFGVLRSFAPPPELNLVVKQSLSSLDDADPKTLPTRPALTVSLNLPN